MTSWIRGPALLLVAAAFLGGCGASSTNPTGTAPGASQVGARDSAETPARSTRPAATTAAPALPSDATAAVKRLADEMTASASPGNAAYKIGAQDMLDISVFKVPELSKSVQVSEAGTINMPLLGEVAASNRTARELEHELTAQLGARYLQNPQVTVYVKEYNSQRVTLEGGGIKKPGVYPLRGRTTLLQALATADGLTDTSNSELVVFRTEQGKRTAARFDISAIRSGDAEDPPLRAGDVVVANTSAAKETLNTVLKLVPMAAFAALL